MGEVEPQRGDVWLANPPTPGADSRTDPPVGSSGKWRPVLVINDVELVRPLQTVTFCPITREDGPNTVNGDPIRVPVKRSDENGLHEDKSWIQIDLITAVTKETFTKNTKKAGRLSDEDMARVEHSLAMFLGLVMPDRGAQERTGLAARFD